MRWLLFASESFQFTHSGPEFKVDSSSGGAVSDFVNINHPLGMPRNLKYRTTMTSPSGTNVQLILPVKSAQQNCSSGNYLQIEDPYRTPSKLWQFCNFSLDIPEDNGVMLQSYLNMLKVIQITNGNGSSDNLKFKMKVKAVVDEDVVQKVAVLHVSIGSSTKKGNWMIQSLPHFSFTMNFLQVLQLTKDKEASVVNNGSSSHSGNSSRSSKATPAVSFIPMGQPNSIGTCDDNLCFNGGFCDPIALKCKCTGHFIGKFTSIIQGKAARERTCWQPTISF